jgi:hypothetical protein
MRLDEIGLTSAAGPVAAEQDDDRPGREPTVGVLCRVPESLHRELRILAAERGTKIQALILREIERLVRERRKAS